MSGDKKDPSNKGGKAKFREAITSDDERDLKKLSEGRNTEATDQSGKPVSEQGRGDNSAEAKKRQAQATAARRNTQRNFQNIQQCLLTENLHLISNYHKQNDAIFKYQTFRQINGESHKIVNKLRGVSRLDEFLNVRTAVLSLLQPKIRIYKVHYEEGQRNPGQKGGSVPTRAPIYKEIKFSDNFGSEVASSVSDYLKYETTKPNWRNVGLQSFNFKQIGRSFGAIEQNIRCDMSIYAKGLKDLLATSPGSDARYIDLLLFPPSARLKSRDTFRPNPKHYEIKVFIGYSRPPLSSIKNISLTPSEMNFLKNIEKFNFMVTLTMSEYNFEIGENGEVTTTISFWGRIGTATGSNTDVFDNSVVVKEGSETKIKPTAGDSGLTHASMSEVKTLLDKIITAKKNPDLADMPIEDLGRLLLENKLFRSLYKEGFKEAIKPNFSPGDVSKALDGVTSKDGAKLLNGLLRQSGARLKNEVYKSFMLQLLDGSGKDGDTRLFAISVDKDSLNSALGVIKTASGNEEKRKKEEIQKETSNAIGLAAKTVRVSRPQDIAGIKQSVAMIESRASENTSNAGEEQRAQEGLQTVEGASKASLITSKTKGDRYDFYFLFVGDIIELAAKNAGMFSVLKDEKPVYNPISYNRKEHGTNYGLTNLRFLLGPMEYNGADGKIRRINLAEFPVSFDLFRTWFLEKVVREDRTKMSFKGFIGSLINNLVLPAMGADCLNPIKMRNVSFQNLFMTLPGKSKDVPNNSKETSFFTEELLPVKNKINAEGPEFLNYTRILQTVTPYDSLIKNSYDYQLVQTTGYKKISSRNGNCNEDMKDGIYHFNIGSDKGLLKRMVFKKVDIPFQQERMSKIAITQGKNQLEQLAFTFDCDLELIGNTLFIPGMIFYANPSFQGLGDPQERGSVAHQLRLGGYYLVLETDLKISPGNFSTNVTAKFIGHGKVKG